jgi:beta-glucosidase
MEIYKDKTQPIENRVEDLLSKMTLEEKAAQLCGDLPASFIVDGKIDIDALREKFPYGHGRFTQYSIVGLVDPQQIADISNKVQEYFVNETRLGIPVALQTENLCGYPAAGGTLFPAMINLGCTWAPELAEKMSEIIGSESRAVGITSAMSPVIDVSRDPRWGRTYETYGEDPYLISQFGINYVRGMQGQGVSCIAKHFLAYAETQGGLNTSAARFNDRELYEVFATPFEAADKIAGLDAVMANYGEIEGLPVITNPHISKTLLRDIMGFKGVLTSDGAAVLKLYNYYKLSKTYEEAGLLAKKGGCDTEIPVRAAFRNLPEYVRSGELDEALIDESVRRVLTIKFKTGLFENPYCDTVKCRFRSTIKRKII